MDVFFTMSAPFSSYSKNGWFCLKLVIQKNIDLSNML